MKLTKREIDILIEAMNSWVERGLAGYEQERKSSKEIAVLIQAKLIQMKDEAMVEDLTS